MDISWCNDSVVKLIKFFKIFNQSAKSFIRLIEQFHHTSLYVLNKVIWRRPWHPTPVLLPGKSHGRRSLVGCSPWGR